MILIALEFYAIIPGAHFQCLLSGLIVKQSSKIRGQTLHEITDEKNKQGVRPIASCRIRLCLHMSLCDKEILNHYSVQ